MVAVVMGGGGLISAAAVMLVVGQLLTPTDSKIIYPEDRPSTYTLSPISAVFCLLLSGLALRLTQAARCWAYYAYMWLCVIQE